MPTYDYECQACGHEFERFQEITAPKLKTCPACGRRKLVRLFGTGAGVIFRGSGFYETDYKRAAKSGGQAAEKPTSSESTPAKTSEAGCASPTKAKPKTAAKEAKASS